MKTAVVRVTIESALKVEAEKILALLGLSPEEAITLFYRQVELHQGLPFEVNMPNSETLKAIEEAISGKNLHRYKSVEEMFEKLKD